MLISVTGYTNWWGKFGVDIASPSKKKKKKKTSNQPDITGTDNSN